MRCTHTSSHRSCTEHAKTVNFARACRTSIDCRLHTQKKYCHSHNIFCRLLAPFRTGQCQATTNTL